MTVRMVKSSRLTTKSQMEKTVGGAAVRPVRADQSEHAIIVMDQWEFDPERKKKMAVVTDS